LLLFDFSGLSPEKSEEHRKECQFGWYRETLSRPNLGGRFFIG
jgi:hypothetical protein